MYAIVETGGKQYRVSPGDTVNVERLEGKIGETVTLDKVLAVERDGSLVVGQPYLEQVRVTARIVRHAKGRKIRVFKMKRRKGYRKTIGHRQWFTGLRIEDILIQ